MKIKMLGAAVAAVVVGAMTYKKQKGDLKKTAMFAVGAGVAGYFLFGALDSAMGLESRMNSAFKTTTDFAKNAATEVKSIVKPEPKKVVSVVDEPKNAAEITSNSTNMNPNDMPY